jgi:peptidoglycan/xylan/chitin deacetylase (PgdA/CDA1 family)
VNPIKLALARTCDATGLNRLLLAAQSVASRPYVRALNYHDVPADMADAFEEQLRFYARHFEPVGYRDLMSLHAGRWPHSRPGLLLTFDDGLRSHAEVVAPLLERHGMTGWFMVPTGVLDGSPHTVREPTLAWDDLRRLDGRHVIGSHTYGHRRLEASLGVADLSREIGEAKRALEEGLSHEVTVFAWVGGEEWSYSAAAASAIRDAGFTVGFMTNSRVIRPGCELLQLQRTNVEASYPPALMRFSLSGIVDAIYTGKRRRVNRLTAA